MQSGNIQIGFEEDDMKSSEYNMFVPCKKGFATFNTFTGSVLFVDEELKSALETESFEGIPPETIDVLVQEGCIVNDDVNEKEILSFRMKNLIYSPNTASFSVLPTYKCNLQCPYCYEGSGEVHTGTMDAKMVDTVITGIKTYCMNTGVHQLGLTLYGGEPLLHKAASVRFAKELGEWAHTVGMQFMCNMITNGTLLTQETLSEFSPFLRMIQVTLDGSKEYHDTRRIYKNGKGTYKSIMDTIKTARENNILVMIRIQVAKDNINTMDTLFKDLATRKFNEDNGIKAYLFPLMEINEVCSSYASLCSEEEARLLPGLWRKAREYNIEIVSKPVQIFISPYCTFAGKNSFLVDALGDVYTCVSVVGKKMHRVARMSEAGLVDITPELYAFTVRDPADIEKCDTCVLLPVCGGGCAYRAYQKYGTYQAGDCTLHKGLEEEKLLLYLEKNYPDKFE
jgi:uncharacterized protein